MGPWESKSVLVGVIERRGVFLAGGGSKTYSQPQVCHSDALWVGRVVEMG